MNVTQLNRDQLEELKQNHYCITHESVSYGELADIDNLISDKEIMKIYSHYIFSEDDFFSSCER